MTPLSFPTHVLTPDNSPDSLWKVDEPPVRLFVQGAPQALGMLEEIPNQGLAVVGTRHPLPRSVRAIQPELARLGGSGLIIISGFAHGIDAVAHESAIQAGLRTIAILGCGLDFDYPRGHYELRRRLLQGGGLLITEYPAGASAYSSNFLRRNRLIAAYSQATLVVEASHRSGALNTAKWAREHHRDCYAVPCFPGDPALAGNQKLIDSGHAEPFWGAHSLGKTWLSLAARQHGAATHPSSAVVGMNADTRALVEQVIAATYSRGGADVQLLLDWAVAKGWSPQRFFDTFQAALENRLLLDENGLLLKNSDRSD